MDLECSYCYIGREVANRNEGSEVGQLEKDQKSRKSDAREFWDDIGVDIEAMSPKGQAVTGLVVGGAVLAGLAAVFLLVPWLWWLIFIFGWIAFPAVGIFARGVAGLTESGSHKPPENEQERELLRAIREHGEITPTQAAMETSLTVSEADAMLKGLTEGGHLQVRARGGGLFYALWESDDAGPGDREISGS